MKTIRFAGELLPQWTQLLDLAARLCPVSEEAREWFARFSNFSGVDDARTVMEQCKTLRAGVIGGRKALLKELARGEGDGQAEQIVAAWMYALDTMIQQAKKSQTCAWIVEGAEESASRREDGGDVELRRF